MKRTIQHPIEPRVDLRDMLRQHLVERSLSCMTAADERRQLVAESGDIASYVNDVKNSIRSYYGDLPVGEGSAAPTARLVSSFERIGYRVENVVFESFPGWEVSASVYVPLDFAPPFPAVIVPMGHSDKRIPSHQLPPQFFARCGYLSVLFDPPGFGEKAAGNDHFVDGVRCYLVGETLSRYFVTDALRSIDYLTTRGDVDLSPGVAVTGVSGGGITTVLAGVLDDRVSVIGSSSCLSPLSDLDITQCYAGCPETHMWRRYADGVDDVDLFCAAAPKPVMLMAGELDEVFRIEDTRRLAEEVRSFFAASGDQERFDLFVDKAGHCYSLAQARHFVRFMNRWLLHDVDHAIPELPDEAFELDPIENLRCDPRTDVNIRTITLHKAHELDRTREKDSAVIRKAAAGIAGVDCGLSSPDSEIGEPFRVWTHAYQQIMLRPEEGIELPSTFLYPHENPTPALLHFDDGGRNRLLESNGILATAAGFLSTESRHSAVMSVDLRGWGDSAPAMYPYELAGWGKVDRCLAYMSAALGDPVMSMRIRDGLAALSYLRNRKEVDSKQIVVSGCGLGGVVALHVAAIAGGVQGVVVWDSLLSFERLLAAEHYKWPADAFVPNVLKHYDLPDLAEALECPVAILNPLDGERKPEGIVPANNESDQVLYECGVRPERLVDVIRQSLSAAIGELG